MSAACTLERLALPKPTPPTATVQILEPPLLPQLNGHPLAIWADDTPDPDLLPPGQQAILDTIATGKRAWMARVDLENAGHAGATIDALVADGLLETWKDGLITLSPLGAWRMGMLLGEHMERIKVEEWRRDPQTNKRKHVRVRRRYLFPHWRRGDGRDNLGDPIRRNRSVHISKCTYEIAPELAEILVDPAPGPLEDVLMFEEVDEEGRPKIDWDTGAVSKSPAILWGLPIPLESSRTPSKAKPRTRGRPRKARHAADDAAGDDLSRESRESP